MKFFSVALLFVAFIIGVSANYLTATKGGALPTKGGSPATKGKLTIKFEHFFSVN